MNDVKRCLGFLGILYKAHKAVIGADVETMLRKNKVHLLIAATDLTSTTSERLLAKAKAQGVEILPLAPQEELGQALSHEKVTLVAIVDAKAAQSFRQK